LNIDKLKSKLLRSKGGGASGGTHLGAQALERISTLFAVI